MSETQTIPLVDLKAQYRDIKEEIDEAVRATMERASFIKGPDHAAFAEEFAAFCGGGYAALCGNGTDALYIALHETLGEGDGTGEIITTSHTFVATTEAIVRAGYKPVFADIDPGTYLLDMDRVKALIGPKTHAILPVHLYGRMAPMDEIMTLAAKHGLGVVEDAAQAHGALYKGKGPGQWGAPACFSFFPGKNLGAYGDGGAIVCTDRELRDRMQSFADHGRKEKYVHDRYGVNSRLDGLQAAVLRVKLRHLEDWTNKRNKAARLYTELLSGKDGIVCPPDSEDARNAYHLYVVRLRDESLRDAVLDGLKQAGIMAGIHYPVPVHEQPAFRDFDPGEGLEETSHAARRILSLPIYPEITPEQVERVAATLTALV